MSIYKLLRFASVLIFTILLFGAQTVFARATAVIDGTTVNVRQEASTSAEILKTAAPGTELEVTQTASGGFYQVNINGTTSVFVHSDFINIRTAQGRVNNSAVNIRSNPSIEGQILGRASYGDTFTVTGRTGEWFEVSHDSVTAFIHSDFLSGAFLDNVPAVNLSSQVTVPTQTAPVVQQTSVSIQPVSQGQTQHVIVTSSTGVNFRANSSTDSEIILAIASGRPAQFLGERDGWYNVRYNGHEGFIFSEFAERRSGEVPAQQAQQPISNQPTIITVAAPSQMAQEIIDFSKQFLGTPYRFGGTDLLNGVDCSGFTFSVFRHFGINLHRVSRDQISNGTRVERNELRIGDLVFFNVGGNTPISHVGIYTGGGRFIHSATGAQQRVIISSLYEPYYIRTFVGGSRILH